MRLTSRSFSEQENLAKIETWRGRQTEDPTFRAHCRIVCFGPIEQLY